MTRNDFKSQTQLFGFLVAQADIGVFANMIGVDNFPPGINGKG